MQRIENKTVKCYYSVFLCCRAIGCIMSTLFYPIITFLLLALCIAYWAVTAVYPSLSEMCILDWFKLLCCFALAYCLLL